MEVYCKKCRKINWLGDIRLTAAHRPNPYNQLCDKCQELFCEGDNQGKLGAHASPMLDLWRLAYTLSPELADKVVEDWINGL